MPKGNLFLSRFFQADIFLKGKKTKTTFSIAIYFILNCPKLLSKDSSDCIFFGYLNLIEEEVASSSKPKHKR
jgi:hypothetical protein